MFRTIPPVTRAIIIANVLVFLLEQVTPVPFTALFALWPLGPLFPPWQVVTYAFLHDPRNILHILFNMFALYMFGGALEGFWGSRRFAGFYFASVLGDAGTELRVLTESKVVEPVIGASGVFFGLLLGFAWFFPRQRLMLL